MTTELVNPSNFKTKPRADRPHCGGDTDTEEIRVPITSRPSKIKKTKKQTQAAFNKRNFGSATPPAQSESVLRRREQVLQDSGGGGGDETADLERWEG
jgi:hypothetical protein